MDYNVELCCFQKSGRVLSNIFITKKRPIMDLRSNDSDLRDCENRISNLVSLLKINRAAQVKLGTIKQASIRRIQEIEQRGVWTELSLLPDFTATFSTVNQVKIVPQPLKDQTFWKTSALVDFNFVKNLCQIKDKKPNPTKSLNDSLAILGPNCREITFTREAAKYQGVNSGLELYKLWKSTFQTTKPKKTITNEIEQKIMEKRVKYGENWDKIATFFNGYNPEDLSSSCQKKLSQIQTGKWNLKQSIQLIVLIDYYGYGKWAPISKIMKLKSQFQIRERYCNVLDPSVGVNKWDSEEQKYLLQMAQDFQYKWSRLVREIPCFSNKTDNALRRKFRNMMIKQKDEDIDRIVKDKNLAKSIKKFKLSYFNRKKVKKQQSPSQMNQAVKNQEF